MVKNLPANAGDAGDTGLIPGLGIFLGIRKDNPLKYSCLENPIRVVTIISRSTAELSNYEFPLIWSIFSF